MVRRVNIRLRAGSISSIKKYHRDSLYKLEAELMSRTLQPVTVTIALGVLNNYHNDCSMCLHDFCLVLFGLLLFSFCVLKIFIRCLNSTPNLPNPHTSHASEDTLDVRIKSLYRYYYINILTMEEDSQLLHHVLIIL